ncbi:hypothetical protein WDZ16_02570 [Pseudokineococcus marinus]|uniref:PRC-barrel domain-containing protein n=1 Tax=Pseudokineococcus marinus TaxID=351215 RepID=A0A849BQE4_9ACTN|nr:hypothetical protein [Pseudokineococcus marinus]NNH21766.1 hypothetical protein [Pseudokineococcus marinus]
MAPPPTGGRDEVATPAADETADAALDDAPDDATTAVDVDGREVGPVTAVFEDDHTGRAELALVALPDGQRLVPLVGARTEGARLHLAVTAAAVEASPVAGDVEHVGPDDVLALYRHHGLSPADDTAAGAAPGADG